jgi:hypothetical protein
MKKSPIKILFGFILGILFSSCDAITKSANGSSESFTYQLSENGCDTGKHSFGSLDDYCTGLENNSLNNNCAYNSRQSLFSQKCNGTFNPFSTKRPLVIKLILIKN